MKIKNVETEVAYWDDGNKNMLEWFRKGAWKRILRKRFIKKQLKDIDKSSC